MISSAAWIQYTNVTDRETDRWTDTGLQQRLLLHIASHGKNLYYRNNNHYYLWFFNNEN